MNKLLFVIVFICIWFTNSNAQMPPPGYERARKIQEERMKISSMERDSITTIDTSLVFNPETSENETVITSARMSVRDYCLLRLNMGNPEKLLDGQPHTIIDPRTFEDITIRLNAAGKIDTIPR